MKNLVVEGKKEEGFVPAIVQFGNEDRSAQSAAEIVETELAVFNQVPLIVDGGKGIASISCVIAQVFIKAAVQGIGPRFEDHVKNSPTGSAILRCEPVVDDLKLLDGVRRRVNGDIFRKAGKIHVAIQVPHIIPCLSTVD